MNTKAILGDYADLGFSLKELGDHFLELYFKEDKIADFNQACASPELIRLICQSYKDSLNGKGK